MYDAVLWSNLFAVQRYGLWDKWKGTAMEAGFFLCMAVILADLSITSLYQSEYPIFHDSRNPGM